MGKGAALRVADFMKCACKQNSQGADIAGRQRAWQRLLDSTANECAPHPLPWPCGVMAMHETWLKMARFTTRV